MATSPTWLDGFFAPPTVQQSGTLVARRPNLNFVGAACSDDPANDAIVINIGGGVAGVCTLEQFGAAGDGTTNDYGAWVLAIAALIAGLAHTLLLGAKTYRIDGPNVPITVGHVAIFGQGAHATTLKTTTNDAVIRIRGVGGAGRVEGVHVANLRILGNSLGSGQNGVEDGYLGSDGSDDLNVTSVVGENLGGRAFSWAYSPAIFGPRFTACKAKSCLVGYYGAGQGNCTGCQAEACGTGLVVASGNVTFNAGDLSDCVIAVDVLAGGNDGHSIVSNNLIDHCTTYAIRVAATTNGMTFIGNHIYQGAIKLTGTPGSSQRSMVWFLGGIIDPTDLTFDGCLARFDVTLDTAYYSSSTFINGCDVDFSGCRGMRGSPPPSWVGPLVSVSLTYPSDADLTLTAQQSRARTIEIKPGVITAGRRLFLARPPTASERVTIINRTGQTLSVHWTSGSSVDILTQTTAVIQADGTNATCEITGSNVLGSSPFPGAVDPTTLALTLLQQASFTAFPWAGTASAGTSGTHSLTDPGGGHTMTVGTAQNGLTPVHSDGTQYASDNFVLFGSIFSTTSYRGVLLFKPITCTADSGTVYSNPGVITENQGNWGVVYSSIAGTPTVTMYHLSGTYKQISAPLPVDGHYHLIDFSYDGTNLHLLVDGVAATPVAAGTLTDPGGSSIVRLAVNFSTMPQDGDYLELWASQSALAGTAASDVKTFMLAKYVY